MEIISISEISLPSKAAAALIEKAVYKISFPNEVLLKEKMQQTISQIMESKEIYVEKKNKPNPVEIRLDIFDLEQCDDAGKPALRTTLAAGSSKNLRPDLVAKLVLDKIGISEIKRSLLAQGAYAAQMTGSGPTVFGLFHSEAKARAACARARNVGFWAALCQPVG
jgi:4-diphosphocytidyl-2C-methyl-D-erythritol kinase